MSTVGYCDQAGIISLATIRHKLFLMTSMEVKDFSQIGTSNFLDALDDTLEVLAWSQSGKKNFS